jgi:hypothetical protein
MPGGAPLGTHGDLGIVPGQLPPQMQPQHSMGGSGAGRDMFPGAMDGSGFGMNPGASSRYMGGMGMMGGVMPFGMMPHGSAHSMVDGPPVTPPPNFNIHSEDFPALPSSSSKAATASSSTPPADSDSSKYRESGGAASRSSAGRPAAGPPAAQPTASVSSGGPTGKPNSRILNARLNFSLLIKGGVRSQSNTSESVEVAPSKETRYGLLGLLDVIKMTDRVKGSSPASSKN